MLKTISAADSLGVRIALGKEFLMRHFMMRSMAMLGVLCGFLWVGSSDAEAQIGLSRASVAGRPPRHVILNDETYEWYLREPDLYWGEQRQWFELEYRPPLLEEYPDFVEGYPEYFDERDYANRYYDPLQPLAIETQRYPAAAVDYHDYYTDRNVNRRISGYRYPASGIAPPPPGYPEWRFGFDQWR